MADELYIDDRLILRGRKLSKVEAEKEQQRNKDLVGNFSDFWEIFTWNSEGKLVVGGKEECGDSRINISCSDISNGCVSSPYFASIGLPHPKHSIRVHSWGPDSPTLLVPQESMMIVVRELERGGISCLLHHHMDRNFIGWKKSVDYASVVLREDAFENNYVGTGCSQLDKCLRLRQYELPVQL